MKSKTKNLLIACSLVLISVAVMIIGVLIVDKHENLGCLLAGAGFSFYLLFVIVGMAIYENKITVNDKSINGVS